MGELTDRQKREVDFFNKYSQKFKVDEACFDSVASTEERPWNPYWNVYKHVLHSFKDSSQRVLDFGCGQGANSMKYAKVGYNVYGFDISDASIKNATKLAEKYNYQDKIKFSIQTAENLSYPSDFFDVVAGTDILHHLEIEKAMKEVHRVLKKGGEAVFIEWIRVPLLDGIRESKFVRWLVPKDASIDRCITEDEEKLTEKDLEIFRNIFSEVTVKRFVLFTHLNIFIKNSALLEKIDYTLFKIFPFLKPLGGQIVIIVKK
jgi:ubiquinone/menaquinone biosynthesis C-methylase UbiE